MVLVVVTMIVTDGHGGCDDDSYRWSWWLMKSPYITCSSGFNMNVFAVFEHPTSLMFLCLRLPSFKQMALANVANSMLFRLKTMNCLPVCPSMFMIWSSTGSCGVGVTNVRGKRLLLGVPDLLRIH